MTAFRTTVCLLAWLLASIFLPARLAQAEEMSGKDLAVAARSLAFLSQRASGELRTVIIYAPDQDSSRREAEAIASLLSGGFTAGRVRLITSPPVLIPASNLSALENKDVAFVTGSLGAWHASIAEASARRRIVTVTNDMSCVTSGNCVMGVRSEPRVQVVINRKLADRSSIEFAPGFRLLVTEL